MNSTNSNAPLALLALFAVAGIDDSEATQITVENLNRAFEARPECLSGNSEPEAPRVCLDGGG